MYELTIIIPVFNEAKVLRRCLSSVPVRDDIQVIVIDDGSTDGSQQIIKEYASFKTIYHKANRGVSVARNEGLTFALGKWVTFLDSDDEMIEGRLDQMLECLVGCEENIVQFNHCRNGSIRPNQHANAREWSIDRLPPKWVLCWNKAYKRKFLEDHRIVFPQGQQFEEDRFFNFKCFEHSPRLVTKEPAIVNKHFDNAQSLCRTVNADKLIVTASAQLELMRKTENEDLKKLIGRCTADLMNSRAWIEAFGGGR